MPVPAIAGAPSGAVRIVERPAPPDAGIARDLEGAEAVAEAIRLLEVRGAPGIGSAAARGGPAPQRGVPSHCAAPERP